MLNFACCSKASHLDEQRQQIKSTTLQKFTALESSINLKSIDLEEFIDCVKRLSSANIITFKQMANLYKIFDVELPNFFKILLHEFFIKENKVGGG
jgi:hypothetical protein